MYVTRVLNRSSPPAVLLRESFRKDGKVKTRTLANLTDWPEAKVEALRRVLRGETLVVAGDRLAIERSLPHGHVVAVLGTLRRIGLDRLLPRRPERLATRALALIAARVVEPAAKLATARQLSEATASHSLGAVLGLGEVDEDELYRALDVLGAAQPAIERALARWHLKNGTLVLYEADGCPVAVEVFAGDTGDPKTLATQIDKLKKRFGLKRVVLVGDRGMITGARIDEELKPAGLNWITALRAPAIQALAVEGGPLQLSLFDDRDMAEISSPDFPGERLVVCRNPALAAERARKRDDLLAATEGDLAKIQAATTRVRRPLRGEAAIALKVGAVLGRRKVAKHFRLPISAETLSFVRDEAAIAAEAALDGFYVLRTSVPANDLDAGAAVLAYKSLAQVERAFRSPSALPPPSSPGKESLLSETSPLLRRRGSVFMSPGGQFVVSPDRVQAPP